MLEQYSTNYCICQEDSAFFRGSGGCFMGRWVFAVPVPGGGACLFCRLPTLPFAFLFAPYPPPPFPGGEGGDQCYFMQGASPLASPGLNPRGTGKGGEPRTRRGACPRRCRLTLPLWYSQGGLSFWSPAYTAFSFDSAPLPRRGRISPRPALAERSSPAGKGEIQGYFMQGASPLASPGG